MADDQIDSRDSADVAERSDADDAELRNMNPRHILEHIVPGIRLAADLSDEELVRMLLELLSEPGRRQKLPHLNTLDDAVHLLRNSRKILVLTGAGVSVSCGIPDFRSKDGVYARLHVDFPDLPDPQAMFDIAYFRKNPKPFFHFAKEIFPGRFVPSLCHRFIKVLEHNDQLLRNYTQNIDTLEQVAGIRNVVHCHGSFATASCCECKFKVDSGQIKQDILDKKVPMCPKCPAERGFTVLKPDITFFGEALSKEFHDTFELDKTEADLLIVIGSSMKVRPVALIPNSMPAQVPQILINREPLSHLNFDIELLGNCDEIVNELCRRLGPPWDSTVCQSVTFPPLHQIDELPSPKGTNKESKASTSNDNEPDTDISNRLKLMYKPRLRKASSCLPENSFLFTPPNRYVFNGAEVFDEIASSGSESDDEKNVDPLKLI